MSNVRVSRESPNWNPHSVRDADGAYTRNQRSGFDACSTSAKLLVQKARRAKARLSFSSTALYFRPEHSNETETARCEYYDVTYRDRTAIVGALQNSRTKSRTASPSNLEGSSCWRIKILRFNADLEISLTEEDFLSKKQSQSTRLLLPSFSDHFITNNFR